MLRKRFILFLILIIITTFFAACKPAEFYPTEGIWYCNELQMQIDFEDGSDCFVMVDGMKMECGAGVDRGSDCISIGCQQNNCPYCYMGEEVFVGYFVSLEADKFVVKDEYGEQYTFVRVD